MTLNKLRKKTVKKYMRENPAGPKTKDEIKQKFDKKIHKINKLRIVGEEVFLDVDNTGIVDNTNTNKKIHKINKLRIVDEEVFLDVDNTGIVDNSNHQIINATK